MKETATGRFSWLRVVGEHFPCLQERYEDRKRRLVTRQHREIEKTGKREPNLTGLLRIGIQFALRQGGSAGKRIDVGAARVRVDRRQADQCWKCSAQGLRGKIAKGAVPHCDIFCACMM